MRTDASNALAPPPPIGRTPDRASDNHQHAPRVPSLRLSGQHDLALALHEIGRIERTVFIIDWLLDAELRRRAQIGLNKGEAQHALTRADGAC